MKTVQLTRNSQFGKAQEQLTSGQTVCNSLFNYQLGRVAANPKLTFSPPSTVYSAVQIGSGGAVDPRAATTATNNNHNSYLASQLARKIKNKFIIRATTSWLHVFHVHIN